MLVFVHMHKCAGSAVRLAAQKSGFTLPNPHKNGYALDAGGNVDDWGRESWALAKTAVYGSLEADPCAPEPTASIPLDDATAARLVPVVRAQIAKAGLRLGRLLDEALDGDHPEVAHPPRPPRADTPPA